MHKIIAATKNKGKIAEIKQILRELPVEVVSMDQEGIDIEIIEDGSTFQENAFIKARKVKEFTRSIVIADDSGLVVDYLGGAPGIYSSRFAGETVDDKRNNEKLLDMLKNVENEKRTARFVCAIAVVFPEGLEITVKGQCEGTIGYELKGDNGFGYDSLFYLPEYQKTMAELEPEVKNTISHRAKALGKLKIELKKYME